MNFSLMGPKHFNCKHTKLTKKTNSQTIYKCDNCNKNLMIVPVKYDPIHPEFFPEYNKPDSQNPDFFNDFQPIR